MQSPESQELSEQSYSDKNGGRGDILKSILLVVILTGSLAVLRFSPLWDFLDTSNIGKLQEKLAEFQSFAIIIFFSGGVMLSAMGTPRSIISIVGGMIFGFSVGMLLSLASSLGGSIILFSLTRHLGRPLFKQNIGQRLNAIEGHIKTNSLLVVVLLRQLPLPCMLVNVLIGLTSIKIGTFIMGTVVGHLPVALTFSLYGSSLREDFIFRVTLASILLILFVLALRLYYKRSPMARDIAKKSYGNDVSK
jgi:uncharacterized membrane protein YdjX (TVP38/TMEM64 family)